MTNRPLPAVPGLAVQPEANTMHDPWGTVLGALIGAGLAIAGFAIGMGLTRLTGKTTSYWYLSRAAGFVGYFMLWGSMIWGLLLSSKIGQGRLRPPALLDAHEFLSYLALGFTLFHGLVLMGDTYLSFPVQAVLVPFASAYKPVLVAAGQIGLWLSLIVGLSYLVRRQLGQRRWRQLHYLSFAAYLVALVHAAFLGTTSQYLAVQVMYVLTAAPVLFLTFFRLFNSRQAPAPSANS